MNPAPPVTRTLRMAPRSSSGIGPRIRRGLLLFVRLRALLGPLLAVVPDHPLAELALLDARHDVAQPLVNGGIVDDPAERPLAPVDLPQDRVEVPGAAVDLPQQ